MSPRFALFGNAPKPGGKYSRIILAGNLKPRRRGRLEVFCAVSASAGGQIFSDYPGEESEAGRPGSG